MATRTRWGAGFCFASFSLISFLYAFAGIFLGVSAKECFIFTLYQVFLFFLPGFAAFYRFYPYKTVSPLRLVFASFTIGYGLNITTYFFATLFSLTRWGILVSLIGMTVFFSAGAFCRKEPVTVLHLNREDAVLIAVFCFFSIVTFFGYCGNTLPSSSEPSVFYHQDSLYWVENAAALKISFPPQELRYSGMRLFYHYFASIYVAVASFATGINCFTIAYSLYNLCRCILLLGGLHFAAQELIGQKKMRLLFLISVLFTTGIERYSLMKYVNQLIFLPFGFDIAVGFGAYFSTLLFRQFNTTVFRKDLCFLSAVLLFLCAGHKAPVAVIYISFAGVLCLGWLMEKKYKHAFLYGGAIIAAFTIVMIGCIGVFLPGESRVNAGSFGLNATLKYTHFYEVLHAYRRLSAAGSFRDQLLSVMTWAGSMILLLLCIHPFMWVAIAIGIFYASKGKKWDNVNIALLFSVVAGTALSILNEQDGMSQLYYCIAGYVPGFLFAMRNIELGRKNRTAITAVLMIFFLVWGAKNYFIDSGVIDTALFVGRKIIYGYSNSKLDGTPETGYPANSFQLSDYEALCWIRDNTERDSLIVSDRDVRMEQRIYMCHGAFSERQMYLEGDVYLYGAYTTEREERRDRIRWLYLNDEEAFEKAKMDGIDYIIQTKWIQPEYLGYGCEPVFESETIRVWKVNE